MLTLEIRGSTLVLRGSSGRHPDCEGDEVVLRLVAPDRATVLYSDRCAKGPAAGCNGEPWFMRGELIALPPGWRRRDWAMASLMDLEIVSESGKELVSAPH